MRINREVLFTFILLIILASLYRVIPDRPWGFTPQIAMAIFAGATIKEKKFAFLLPLLSMFLSDLLYELLYRNSIGKLPGFYDGQVSNYILVAGMTIIGFYINSRRAFSILLGAITAPTVYFLLSNFVVWISNGGLQRPKNLSGLLLCYEDGFPFYPWSVVACIIFSGVLFGVYHLAMKLKSKEIHNFNATHL